LKPIYSIFITFATLFQSLFTSGIHAADNLRIMPITAGYAVPFAIETDSGLFLIDAGWPGNEKTIFAQLAKFSKKKLKLIIITHSHIDHFGSASALREMTGAKIAISEVDAAYMAQGQTPIDSTRSWGTSGKFFLPLGELILRPAKTPADMLLHDGDSLHCYGLPAVVYATPGHTDGSVSLILDNKTAFVSDLIVVHPARQAQCYFAMHWSEIPVSIRKIAALKPEFIYSGHSSKPIDLKTFTGLVDK
jgi:glyoxylase-like metal-dependent hydrolase (beta-lactamase superfamily II)